MAANSNEENTSKQRRSNKPLMEKRRRERINKSLSSLKELVLTAEKRDISKFTKLEKADILDMAVRHLKSLHEKSDTLENTKRLLERYREGFERCAFEVENFFNSKDNLLPSDTQSKLMSHLQTLSKAVTKDAITFSSKGTTHRVKATIDSSILKADIIKHESSSTFQSVLKENNGIEACKSIDIAAHPMKFEVYIPSGWGGASPHPFPPSPPDSSRCSSSPDSLRGSPKMFFETSSLQHHHSLSALCSAHTDVAKDLDSSKQSPALSSPLNLKVPQSSSRDSTYCSNSSNSLKNSSINTDAVKKESLASALISKKDSSLIVNELSSNLELTSESNPKNTQYSQILRNPKSAIFRRVASVENLRHTPYPKKDAVKRYQQQNSPDSLVVGLRPDLPHSSHWRPW